MTAVQESVVSMGSGYGPCGSMGGETTAEQFPAGLRVLVVDDDIACLRILEQMLRKCLYRVTICCRATKALSLLRERKGDFDIVISDVHMPDMDGFRLLELVGLEMDLPVIMMSADGRTSAVMRGIKHGACDYLIKPVRMEELKNIWQHIVRKKWNGNKELEHSGSLEDSDRQRRTEDDAEYASSIIDGSDNSWQSQKKKRDAKEEEDGELENEDPSTSKKPRVVWSVELHQQFVSAVSQLGIDKAVPKRILELMNVPGLTRENVASHLQKFRLFLKRLSGVAPHQSGLPNPFCGNGEPNAKVNSVGRLNIQALVASGQIPPHTLTALHAELLGQPSNCLVFPASDQPALLQASAQGPQCIPFEHGSAYGQPLLKCQSNIHKQFPQCNLSVEGMPADFSNFSSHDSDAAGSASNLAGVNNVQNGNVLLQMLQQQQFPGPLESGHAINVQPSCLLAPYQPSSSFQMGNNSMPINQSHMPATSHSLSNFQIESSYVPISQNCNINNSSKVIDCTLLSSQSSTIASDVGQVSDGDSKNVPMLKGYLIPGSISTLVSPCSGNRDSSMFSQANNPSVFLGCAGRMSGFVPSLCAQGSGTKAEALPGQGQGRNLGFVGKGECIPRRFAVDDFESPTNEISDSKTCIINDNDRVRQELLLDFKDASKAGSSATMW